MGRTNRMENEAVLRRVKEEWTSYVQQRRRADWVGHFCIGTAFEITPLKETKRYGKLKVT